MIKNQTSKSLGTEILGFFASVKLALVLLIALAGLSILGTILPQGESLDFYNHLYTSASVKLILFFQLYDLYHSWWFQWILLVLSANLIICSIKRFSSTWKVVTSPPRAISPRMFETLAFHRKISLPPSTSDPKTWAESFLRQHFGNPTLISSTQGTAFFVEKGRFSRFGVYLVHISVLVIFIGVIIGSLFGFKGFLELKEGESRDRIFIEGSQTRKDLGFSVRLDQFKMTFYSNGMPREYRSDLSFLKNGEKKQQAQIRVNDPFTYNGITFYQSSWDQSLESIDLVLKKEGQEISISLPMGKKVQVPGTPYSLEVVRYIDRMGDMGPAVGMILYENQNQIDQGWILAHRPDFHGNRLGVFRLQVKAVKTVFVSGMQVNRDPGVWFIWIGASLMVIGFIVTFYFSHQQIWLWIREEEPPTKDQKTVWLGGTAHKNRGGFVLKMERILEKIRRI